MEKTWHRFRVRQRVHYYPEGRASKKLTGPWIVLGVVKEPDDGEFRYRIKNRSTELVAREEDLKLVLRRSKKTDG